MEWFKATLDVSFSNNFVAFFRTFFFCLIRFVTLVEEFPRSKNLLLQCLISSSTFRWTQRQIRLPLWHWLTDGDCCIDDSEIIDQFDFVFLVSVVVLLFYLFFAQSCTKSIFSEIFLFFCQRHGRQPTNNKSFCAADLCAIDRWTSGQLLRLTNHILPTFIAVV